MSFCFATHEIVEVAGDAEGKAGRRHNPPCSLPLFHSTSRFSHTCSIPFFPSSPQIRVTLSTSKNRLFLGGFRKDIRADWLERRLRKDVVGVDEIDMPMATDGSGDNKGFAFVNFFNNACASKAFETMQHVSFTVGYRHPTVKWAEPRKVLDPDSAAVQNVKNIYVSGFSEGTSQDSIEQLFAKYGDIERVFIPGPKPGALKPPKPFAFVHFKERSSACAAADPGEKLELNGTRRGPLHPYPSLPPSRCRRLPPPVL